MQRTSYASALTAASLQPLRFRGFIVSDLYPQYEEEFYATVPRQIAAGELKIKEHHYKGLENAGKAFQDMLSGKGFGKVLLTVAEE
jgi:NADPH-dependent curcumin reductase CurA